MPKLTGIQVLEKVRSSNTFSKIPFIMITTENEKANVVAALKLGVTDYIIKPFDVEKFKEKILKIFELNELDF
jgi:two-component system chemotaxis response regulator CheY